MCGSEGNTEIDIYRDGMGGKSNFFGVGNNLFPTSLLLLGMHLVATSVVAATIPSTTLDVVGDLNINFQKPTSPSYRQRMKCRIMKPFNSNT